MSKTPFEIRLDLLAMAQSILETNLYAERNRLENDWNTQRELAIIDAQKNDVRTLPAPVYPTLPTISIDEMISLAGRLNDFVSNQNNKE